MRLFILLFVLWMLPGSVSAQESNDQRADIRITADPRPPEVVSKDLAEGEALHFPELAPFLSSFPGVSGTRMGGHGIDPVIRGQGQSRVNVIRDGAFIYGGCPNRMDPATSYISPTLFDDVTVVRGVETLRHGPGGSGGTVLVNRRAPAFTESGQFQAQAHSAYGSNGDDRILGGDIAGALSESAYLRLGGVLSDANDYKDGAGNTVRSSYEQNALSAEVGVEGSDGLTSSFSFDLSDGDDILFAGSEMDSPDSDSYGAAWKFAYAPTDSDVLFDGEVYSNRVQHLMDNYSLRTLASGRAPMFADTRSNTVGARVGATHTMESVENRVGIDVRSLNQHAERFSVMQDMTRLQSVLWPDVTQTVLGGYLETKWQADELTVVSGGVRFDRAFSEGDWVRREPAGDFLTPAELYQLYYGATDTAKEDENVSAIVGIRRKLANDLAVELNLARSVRTPDISERFIASNGMMPQARWVGNPDLDPEVHHTVAPSISWTNDSLTTSTTLFYDWANDYITRDRARGQSGVMQSDLASIYRNVSAELWGGEVDTTVVASAESTFRVWLAYVNGTNTDDSRPLAQIPPLSGGASLLYTREKLSVEPGLRFALKQTRADLDIKTGSGLDVQETAGYVTADVKLGYRIFNGGHLELLCSNIFDQEYSNHLNRGSVFDAESKAVNEPGRSFVVQFRIEG